jgi:hypothetical protein
MLPQNLPEALDALENDKELTDLLGEYFVGSFIAYKRNEIERFSRFVTDWEFTRVRLPPVGPPELGAGTDRPSNGFHSYPNKMAGNP